MRVGFELFPDLPLAATRNCLAADRRRPVQVGDDPFVAVEKEPTPKRGCGDYYGGSDSDRPREATSASGAGCANRGYGQAEVGRSTIVAEAPEQAFEALQFGIGRAGAVPEVIVIHGGHSLQFFREAFSFLDED